MRDVKLQQIAQLAEIPPRPQPTLAASMPSVYSSSKSSVIVEARSSEVRESELRSEFVDDGISKMDRGSAVKDTRAVCAGLASAQDLFKRIELQTVSLGQSLRIGSDTAEPVSRLRRCRPAPETGMTCLWSR